MSVEDHTPPVLTLPEDIVTTATSDDGAVVNYTVTAHDVAFGDIAMDWPPSGNTCTPPSGSVFPVGTTTVSCHVEDPAGVPANGSFTVTVEPLPANTPPVVTAPDEVTVEATSSEGAFVEFETSAFDAEDGSLPVLFSFPWPGAEFPLGDTTVWSSAVDSGGLSHQVTTIVHVVDTTAPQLIQDVIEVTATSAAGATVEYPPMFSDAVGVFNETCEPPTGSVFPVGVTGVTCQATDQAGNTANETFYVNVLPPPPLEIPAAGCYDHIGETNGPDILFNGVPDVVGNAITKGPVQWNVPGAIDRRISDVHVRIHRRGGERCLSGARRL